MTRKTTYVRFFQDAHRINRENQGIYCTPLDEAEGRPRERAAQISKQFEVLACATATAAVIESLEVQFSDHTKKAVLYNLGSVPQEIQPLSTSLAATFKKLDNELPRTTRCGY